MSQQYALAFITLTSLLIGCNSVSVEEPFGQPVSASEREKLIGVWQVDNDRIEVQQTNAGNLIAGVMDWNEEKERFEVNNADLLARHLGQHNFVLMREVDEPEKEEGWDFVRYEHGDDNTLKIYTANAKTFQAAVESGRLVGSIKKEKRSVDVKVTSSQSELESFLKETGVDACFLPEALELKPFSSERSRGQGTL